MINIDSLNFDKLNGLIPAIIIDTNGGKVLMLGFMNKESLLKTLEKKLAVFYSRTKKALWTKGETSGNYLKIVDIKSDCDNDTLLISVEPTGPVCHTGNYTCFGEKQNKSLEFLNKLYELIKERKKGEASKSYTRSLFEAGENRIIQKFGEESIETLIALKNSNKEEILEETADLIYHLFVALAEKDIDFFEIVEKLKSRNKPK